MKKTTYQWFKSFAGAVKDSRTILRDYALMMDIDKTPHIMVTDRTYLLVSKDVPENYCEGCLYHLKDERVVPQDDELKYPDAAATIDSFKDRTFDFTITFDSKHFKAAADAIWSGTKEDYGSFKIKDGYLTVGEKPHNYYDYSGINVRFPVSVRHINFENPKPFPDNIPYRINYFRMLSKMLAYKDLKTITIQFSTKDGTFMLHGFDSDFFVIGMWAPIKTY